MANEVVPMQAGQALALEGGDIKLASEACSKGLWSLLSSGDDSKSACRLIAINPTLRAELQRIEPFLRERSKPMTPEAMILRLMAGALVYGVPDRTPEAWSTVFQAYLEALDGFTAEALDHAFVRWNRGEGYPNEPKMNSFMPKPADLFRLGQPVRLQLSQAVHRARKALEHIEATTPRQTPEEKAAERQRLIDEGIMVVQPDGTLRVNLGQPMLKDQGRVAPGLTPAQLAQKLRDEAARRDEPDEAV